MSNLGIYIHIPFCLKKCDYCDFVSFTHKRFDDYFCALNKEIELYKNLISKREVDSIFIGGGTPSVVCAGYITEVLGKFNKTKDCEITIEVNPKTVNEEKLKEYKNAGINRISIGMQSAVDKELKKLNRIHNFEEFKECYNLVRKCGFSNVNIDIMFGIPYQTYESFIYTLGKAKELNPEHISCYSLIVEENTPFYNMKLELPDEETERRMYENTPKILKNYMRYEISNYSKKGYECRHNMKYWEFQDYLGLGVNAHSFTDGVRNQNTDDFDTYIEKIKKGEVPVINSEKESNEELLKDYIITGLRLVKGIDINTINEKFKIDFLKEYESVIKKYAEEKYMILENNSLKFTEKGFSISNYILCDFI